MTIGFIQDRVKYVNIFEDQFDPELNDTHWLEKYLYLNLLLLLLFWIYFSPWICSYCFPNNNILSHKLMITYMSMNTY